jgi:DNA-binding response OmpR family regulator
MIAPPSLNRKPRSSRDAVRDLRRHRAQFGRALRSYMNVWGPLRHPEPLWLNIAAYRVVHVLTPTQQYQVQLATLQLTIDTQAAEIRHLRRQLGIDLDTETVRLLVRASSLNYGEATLLMTLYRAEGRPVDAHRLLAALEPNDHAAERTPKQVGVRVHRIRRKLWPHVIGSSIHHKSGYWITETGKSYVDAKLAREKAA